MCNSSKMYQINLILPVVLLLSSVFYTTFGDGIEKQEITAAVVPEPKVSGVIGHAVNISCKSVDNYALRSCHWERLNLTDGKRYVVNINSHGINGSTSSSCANCKYEYAGKGLHEGDCTISIKNATEFHAGNWECLLFGKPVDHTWIGQLSVELDKIEPVGDPYWENEDDLHNIIYNQASPKVHNISCCVKIPPCNNSVRLQLDYGNQIISTSLPIRVGAGLNATFCDTSKHQFFPQSKDKLLTCSVLYIYQAQEHVKKTSILIDVKFGPKISMNSPVQHRNESNAFVTVEFSANPKPVWEWFALDVDNEDSNVEIKDNKKYVMSYVDLKDDNYTATLKVKNITEDDCKRQFMLRVSNKYGVKELYFKIVESEPYWLMILIGIGAVAICLVFFIVLFIILSKRNIRTYSPTPVVYDRASQNAQIATINSVGRT